VSHGEKGMSATLRRAGFTRLVPAKRERARKMDASIKVLMERKILEFSAEEGRPSVHHRLGTEEQGEGQAEQKNRNRVTEDKQKLTAFRDQEFFSESLGLAISLEGRGRRE